MSGLPSDQNPASPGDSGGSHEGNRGGGQGRSGGRPSTQDSGNPGNSGGSHEGNRGGGRGDRGDLPSNQSYANPGNSGGSHEGNRGGGQGGRGRGRGDRSRTTASRTLLGVHLEDMTPEEHNRQMMDNRGLIQLSMQVRRDAGYPSRRVNVVPSATMQIQQSGSGQAPAQLLTSDGNVLPAGSVTAMHNVHGGALGTGSSTNHDALAVAVRWSTENSNNGTYYFATWSATDELPEADLLTILRNATRVDKVVATAGSVAGSQASNVGTSSKTARESQTGETTSQFRSRRRRQKKNQKTQQREAEQEADGGDTRMADTGTPSGNTMQAILNTFSRMERRMEEMDARFNAFLAASGGPPSSAVAGPPSALPAHQASSARGDLVLSQPADSTRTEIDGGNSDVANNGNSEATNSGQAPAIETTPRSYAQVAGANVAVQQMNHTMKHWPGWFQSDATLPAAPQGQQDQDTTAENETAASGTAQSQQATEPSSAAAPETPQSQLLRMASAAPELDFGFGQTPAAPPTATSSVPDRSAALQKQLEMIARAAPELNIDFGQTPVAPPTAASSVPDRSEALQKQLEMIAAVGGLDYWPSP